MPRFTILEHDWPQLHWDLLLEAGSVLRAWRLLTEPGPACVVPAEPNTDHRRLYLDYEGLVSGNRGNVRQWDTGTFDWLLESALCIRVTLCGARLVASCEIARDGAGTLTATFE